MVAMSHQVIILSNLINDGFSEVFTTSIVNTHQLMCKDQPKVIDLIEDGTKLIFSEIGLILHKELYYFDLLNCLK